jgi:hypothetical protein
VLPRSRSGIDRVCRWGCFDKQDLKLDSAYVVAPVRTRYPLAQGVEV